MSEVNEIKVQIIIPTYNRRHKIVGCINSILAQSYGSWKIVIVDNASTDGTESLIKEQYKALIQSGRLEFYRFDELLPIIENWNRCVSYIDKKYKYMKFLWSDDVILPNYLDELVHKMESCDNLDGVGSWINYVDSNKVLIGKRKYGAKKLDFYKSIFYKNSLGCPSSVLLRTNAFASVRFNTQNRYVADLQHLMDVLQPKSYFVVEKYLVDVEIADKTETSTLFGSDLMIENKIKFMQYGVEKYLSNNFFDKIIYHMMRLSLRLYFKIAN